MFAGRREGTAMTAVTRRRFLGSMAAGGAAGLLVARPETGAGATAAPGPGPGVLPALTVRSGDPRYLDLTSRCYNARFAGHPDYVRVVHSAEQTVAAVQDAVSAGARLAVRSGGHCLEDLVDDPAVRVLIDISEMNAVYFDESRRAFAVEAGATLGQVYRHLYLEWGVTIPGGTCPTVGVGGHVTGGGYGALCRAHGTVIDHLAGVEVVVVDGDGRARPVVATAEPGDPDRELWWAHTGGGGGNFGIVTRFWFRTPGSDPSDPGAMLPRPPERLQVAAATWPWESMTAADFGRLVANHGAWHERNSAYGSPYDTLHSLLTLHNVAAGPVTLTAQIDGTLPDAARLLNDYIAAVSEGVRSAPAVATSGWPWLRDTLRDVYDTGAYNRTKSKGAYLRRRWSDAQIATLYRYLSDRAYQGHAGVLLYSYGGKVNTVAPSATALPQRDSILKANFTTYWPDPADDAANLAWIRAMYKDVYADTGGVPVPDTSSDGSYINYPDTDLKDPRWNTSGVPWQTLYYKEAYPRLQRVKAAYDPLNVFRHPLSISSGPA
jgi:FAD/FMN-containing dehydrogenase